MALGMSPFFIDKFVVPRLCMFILYDKILYLFLLVIVMFIRKKSNKSGTVSIMLVTGDRLAGKKHPVSRIIKNFGHASNETELNDLIQQAQAYKEYLVSHAPRARALRIASDADLKSCRSFNVGFSDVYGCFFKKAFDGLPLKINHIKQLQDLIVMRIASPASKRKTVQLSHEFGIELNVDGIYKLMDRLTDETITHIKKSAYDYTAHLLSKQKETIDVLFYDLTTVYFETSSQDDLRDFGFSKDGKHQHVQIMLAVIVTKNGLPVDYEEFPGNCYEGHTLIPVIDKIKDRYNIGKVVMVADSALMNKINLQTLEDRGIKYVIAARAKNASKEIKQQILDLKSYKSTSTIVDEHGVLKDEIKSKIIQPKTGGYIVAYHSSKRARKDEFDRAKDMERIRKYINSTAKSKLTGSLRKPYVKISKDCKIDIDLDKLENQKQFDGIFALQTNISDFDVKELLSTYRGLWQVEQTFRIAKSNLEIRPVFHYTPRRIKAHFAICYMALAVVRYVEFTLQKNRLHIPCEQLHLLLDRMRTVRIKNNKEEWFEFLEDPPPELIPVYQALKISWHKRFSYHTHL
jgi:transposase